MQSSLFQRAVKKVLAHNLWRVLAYALSLGLAAFALQWLEYQYLIRQIGVHWYLAATALGFMALGLWAGLYLTTTPADPQPPPREAALRLGLTRRESEVLTLLAQGMSNKEIARGLGLSPNTVKTHLARVFEKLQVKRRTQAIRRAREQALLP